MAKLLLVEDEAHLATGIKFNLELEGHDIDVVADGALALKRVEEGQTFDLILLDVMLPGIDGFEVVKRLRQGGNYTPVLMLTAKGLPEDLVQGLEAGADDYLPKPFDLTVLLARVKGLLRRRDWARGGGEGPERIKIGEVEVDFRTFEVFSPNRKAQLTLLEAMLLKLLAQNAGRVVSKAEILDKVWNLSPDTQTRAVDNFVLRLRRYLEVEPSQPKHLQTVRGAGYRLIL